MVQVIDACALMAYLEKESGYQKVKELLDRKTFGVLKHVSVDWDWVSGDLKYGRTVHSLAAAMAMFNAEMYFVAPEQLQMPNYIIEDLQKSNINYHIVDNMQDVIGKVDILYMTRIQKERFPDLQEYEKVKNVFILNKKLLETAKPNKKIMHPLPRVNEISEEVDIEPHAYYFNQAHYGIPVRMAIIALLLGCVK